MLDISRSFSAVLTASLLLASFGIAHAETVMQQCGQQYQAAKAAGTLNGMTWSQFRADCSARLKAQPAAATTTTPAAPAANPLNPTPAAIAPAPAPAATPTPTPTTTAAAPAASVPGSKPAATGGRAAFIARERECGAEWKANKVTLIAQTPGLKWPKYLSECNARLKAAGK